MYFKKALFILLAGFCLLFTCCGGDKYSEVVEVNQEYLNAMRDYIQAVEESENADQIADAINQFADKMETLAPRMRKIAQDYPELKNKENQSEALIKQEKEAKDLAQRFAGTFQKIMPYMGEEKVQTAQKHLTEAMQGITQQ